MREKIAEIFERYYSEQNPEYGLEVADQILADAD